MKYRNAEIEDLETLNSISIQSKAFWGYPSAWMEEWKEDLTLDEDTFSQNNILVGESNSKVIGFCVIGESPENYEILHLWLLPAFIGKGIGKALLHKSLDTFVTAEKPIIVEADPNAESFYKKQGFVTFDQVESYPNGRFLPVMIKSIKER
jgi:ribosomal protein S18 acetylase RimI-like enzyme